MVEHALDANAGHACLLPGREKKRLGAIGLCAIGALVLVLLGLGLGGGFLWTLQRDQNSAFLRGRLVETLTSALGADKDIAMASATMRLAGFAPRFSVEGLTIADPHSGAQARIGRLDFALSSSIWRLNAEPTRIDIDEVTLLLPAKSDGAPVLKAPDLALGAQQALVALAARLRNPDDSAPLRAVNGRNIAIQQAGPSGSRVTLLEGLTFEARHDGPRFLLTLGREGRKEHIGLALWPPAEPEGPIRLALEPLHFSAVSGVLGVDLVELGPQSEIDLRIAADPAAGGRTRLDFALRNAAIRPQDPQITPFVVDSAALALEMDPASQEIAIRALALKVGEFDLTASGRIWAEDGYRLEVSAEKPALDRLSPEEAIVVPDKISVSGRIAPDWRSVLFERIEIQDGAGRASGSFAAGFDQGGYMRSQMVAEGLDLRRALRVWPVTVAHDVRQWVVRHASAGRLARLDLASDLTGQALTDALAKRPIPDAALSVAFALEDVTIRPILDAPPVSRVRMRGQISGRHSAMQLSTGQIEAKPDAVLIVRDAEFIIANTALHPANLEIRLPFSGPIDAAIAVLSTPSLRKFASVPGSMEITTGSIDAVASGVIRLVPKPEAGDVRIEMRGDLSGVNVDNIVKGEKLEAGAFQLQSKNGLSTLKGEARLSGAPAQIELKAEAGKPAIATVKTSLDDAQRARRGLDLKPFVTGPIGVNLQATLNAAGPPGLEVELDLAKAKVEGPVPGLAKRAGAPGKVAFALVNEQDRTILRDVNASLGNASASGTLEFKDGQLVKADFATLKLSPGDISRLLIERKNGGLRLVLRGNSFDMRPFLRGFQSGKVEDGKANDLEIDIQSTVLVGFNNELIGGAEILANTHNQALASLALKGRFGAAPIQVDTVGQRRNEVMLRVTSADAGALARFLDIYPRIQGGRLGAELRVGANGQKGLVQVQDFSIKGEPSLKQFAALPQSNPSRRESDLQVSQSRALDDSVEFSTFRADFARQPGRLDLAEAVMWGGQIGGSLEGYLDYANDRVDLKGAFVPAYALNNLFSQVPILGPLLGGSQYEGLFALPFVISGKASAPVLRTNPISAIAPGFLRRFFEIQRDIPANAPERANPVR